MIYESIPVFSTNEIEDLISRNSTQELIYVALSAALYSNEMKFAEDICADLSVHKDSRVRANAILAFSHIARLHGALNEKVVKPIIEKALVDTDANVRGQAIDVVEDLRLWLNWKFEE